MRRLVYNLKNFLTFYLLFVNEIIKGLFSFFNLFEKNSKGNIFNFWVQFTLNDYFYHLENFGIFNDYRIKEIG